MPVATNHGPGGRPRAPRRVPRAGQLREVAATQWRAARLAGRRLTDLVADDERALPAFLILGAAAGRHRPRCSAGSR